MDKIVWNLCLDHVIRTGQVNVEIGVEIWLFIYFFGFCHVKKKETLWNLFIKIMQSFLYLEGALKLISQEQFKKHNNQNIQNSMQIS